MLHFLNSSYIGSYPNSFSSLTNLKCAFFGWRDGSIATSLTLYRFMLLIYKTRPSILEDNFSGGQDRGSTTTSEQNKPFCQVFLSLKVSMLKTFSNFSRPFLSFSLPLTMFIFRLLRVSWPSTSRKQMKLNI